MKAADGLAAACPIGALLSGDSTLVGALSRFCNGGAQHKRDRLAKKSELIRFNAAAE